MRRGLTPRRKARTRRGNQAGEWSPRREARALLLQGTSIDHGVGVVVTRGESASRASQARARVGRKPDSRHLPARPDVRAVSARHETGRRRSHGQGGRRGSGSPVAGSAQGGPAIPDQPVRCQAPRHPRARPANRPRPENQPPHRQTLRLAGGRSRAKSRSPGQPPAAGCCVEAAARPGGQVGWVTDRPTS